LKRTGPFFLKRDDLALGLILGFIMPIIVFIFIYFLRFSEFAFGEYVRTFFRERSLITFFGVWCLVGNIALFTLYINTRKDRTAKGIFAITLVYGIGVLLLKVLT
jgi:hypothetical protein